MRIAKLWGRDPRDMAILLAILAAAVLMTAYGFELILDLAPCKLCLYQRIPWWLTLGLAALIYRFAQRPHVAAGLLWLAALTLLASAGLAFYHAGIEYGAWAGPETCSGTAALPQSLAGLKDALANAVVRCDAPAWTLFGISMAGYNVLISLLAGLYGGMAAFRHRPS